MSKKKTIEPKRGFGDAKIERLKEFESILMERFRDGYTTSNALSGTDASAAMVEFSWNQFELKREVSRCWKVFNAFQVIGTPKQRQELEDAAEKAAADHAKLVDELADQRRELDRKEKASEQNARLLERRHNDVVTNVSMLRDLIPSHEQEKYNASVRAFHTGARSDHTVAASEIHFLETLIAGPVRADGEPQPRADMRWINRIRMENPKFATADQNGKWHTTAEWEKFKRDVAEKLPEMKKREAELRAIMEAEEAKLESLKNYYLEQANG